MKKFLKVMAYARQLFWFLEMVMRPTEAAEALLSHPRVNRWLEHRSPEDQRKIREAAPLVVEALLASLD